MQKILKHPFFALILACASLFYMPLGMRALWDTGESRYAEVAREMLQLKDWLIPHLNYVVYLDRPPLMYWLTATTMQFFGPTAFAARFWSAAFGLLTIGITYVWGRSWKNERLGLLAGGILATSIGFFVQTQVAAVDMALTFWTTLALFAGSGLFVERSVHRVRRLTYLLAIGMAGGVMTKGPGVMLLILAALTAVYWGQGRRIPVVKRPWKAAIILGLALVLPWYVGVFLKYPVYPYYLMVHDYSVRFGADPVRVAEPFYYFIPVLLLGFLPWAVFLPRVIKTWLTHHHAAMQRDSEGAVMVAWVGLVVAFFSLLPAKSVGAILPVFPALALLVANEFDEVLDIAESPAGERMPDWIGHGVAALIVLLGVALLLIKLPPHVLAVNAPEWKTWVDQGGLLALAIGFGVFILVGVWGMRQTLTCVGGVMLLQVMLLTSASSLAPDLDPYQSSRLMADRLNLRGSANDAVVMYRPAGDRIPYGLPFYTDRRIVLYGLPGELTLGQELDTSTDALWFAADERAEDALVAMPGGTWAMTSADHWQLLRQNTADMFQQVYQAGDQVLLRKQR